MRIKTLMRYSSGIVEARESLAAAAMRLASDPGGCLVVTDGGRLAGVLTPADARAAGPSTRPCLAVHEVPAFTSGLTLADAMRRVALDIKRRHGAMLTLLHVMRGLSLRVAEGLPAGVDADVQRWRLAEARAALVSLVPREDRSMTRVDVLGGDVVEGVLNSAATMGAELIVMGGRPGAAVVRETIRRAPCPVFAV